MPDTSPAGDQPAAPDQVADPSGTPIASDEPAAPEPPDDDYEPV